MFDEIICAFNGKSPKIEEILDETPVNWIKVSIEKQLINPQWAAIQMVKRGLVETALQNIPEEYRDMQRMGIEIQVTAQFHSYESEVEKFITISEEVYVSPPSKNASVRKAWEDLADTLGLTEDFVSDELQQGEEEEDESEE